MYTDIVTLIVGILCDKGVAIAADSQATAAAHIPLANPAKLQTHTHSVTKVARIGNEALLGVSGYPPIGDEYEKVIKPRSQQFATRNYEFATNKLKDEIRNIINKHLDTAKRASKLIDNQAYDTATCECLLAANFKDGVKLIQIERQGSFEVLKSEFPLVAIGSGQMHADPFLVYLRNTFWPDKLPTVEEGVLAATWAIDYAIEVGAPLVGGEIVAFSVRKAGNKARVEQATADKMRTNLDFIGRAREQLRDLAKLHHTTPADASKVPTME